MKTLQSMMPVKFFVTWLWGWMRYRWTDIFDILTPVSALVIPHKTVQIPMYREGLVHVTPLDM